MVSGRLGQYLSKHPGEDKEKTGHFLGNHSVLDILRMEGYEIVHLPSDHQEQVTESERDRDLPAAGSVEEPSDTSTVTPTSWSTSLEEEMKDPEDVPGLEEEELPHMLLPDNLNQLEEFGRHKRPHKAQRSHVRPRLFSDLWVRMGESTPPPNMRITSGYITVDTPLTHQEHHRQLEIHSIERHNSPFPTLHSLCSAHLAKTSLTLSCILVWFLSHMLLTS